MRKTLGDSSWMRSVTRSLIRLAASPISLLSLTSLTVAPLSRGRAAIMSSASDETAKMKVAELREALMVLGEPTSGKKAELVARLESARRAVTKTPPPKRKKGAVDVSSATTTTSPAPRRRKGEPLELEPPEGWRATYDLITELRADRTAVVDTMGSEAIADGSGSGMSVVDRDYQTLVSLMLSSQTKDTVNAATMVKLRAHGLSVENILATSDETLDELIHAVGFHNNKVRFIKEASAIIQRDHGGAIPTTMEGLMALPGVGPKMALIVMRVAFGKVEGISVDTHVHRISNQLAWTGGAPTKTPEKTREAIEAWMPRDIWGDVNLLLVGFGQEIQTEKPKLLRKCLACSDPQAALALVGVCGVDVDREMAKLEK